MTKNIIIKEADLMSSMLQGIKDQINLEKPFETAFSILGTGLSFRFGWMIGGLITAAQLSGYGPGKIGAYIDEYFKNKGAKNINEMEFTSSNVEGASNYISSKLSDVINPSAVVDKIKNIFSSNLNDLRLIKKSSKDDKIIALYLTTNTLGFEKTAKVKDVGKFLKLLKGGKPMTIISSIIMKLIWTVIKGLGAIGVGSGVASAVGLKTKTTSDPKEEGVFKPDKDVYGPAVPNYLKYYTNVSNDIKKTLIKFLDATIANFSVGFTKAQMLNNPSKPPVSVENAPGWSKILSSVEKYNWGSIPQINSSNAFVAPRIMDIANTLMKSVKISGVKIEKLDTKPLPKLKPKIDDEARLRQLLKGETRI